MIGAHLELCRATADESYCSKAEQLARASFAAFPADAAWTPAADAIYLRFLVDLYRHDHDPAVYAVVYRNAERALANAPGLRGLYVRHWDGRRGPGTLIDHAATLSLFAWLATVDPPKA